MQRAFVDERPPLPVPAVQSQVLLLVVVRALESRCPVTGRGHQFHLAAEPLGETVVERVAGAELPPLRHADQQLTAREAGAGLEQAAVTLGRDDGLRGYVQDTEAAVTGHAQVRELKFDAGLALHRLDRVPPEASDVHGPNLDRKRTLSAGTPTEAQRSNSER